MITNKELETKKPTHLTIIKVKNKDRNHEEGFGLGLPLSKRFD